MRRTPFRHLLAALICGLLFAPASVLGAERRAAPDARKSMASAPAVILLDPGHSPAHPGARSCTGRAEHLYNYDLAAAVAAHLRERGIAAELTRGPKDDVSLAERASRAKGRRLFLSLHHDSAQPQFVKMADGSPRTEKPEAEGYSLFVSAKNRWNIESLYFARDLGRALREAGLKPSSHHGERIRGENRRILDEELGIYAFDDLVVLKRADAPAVLLEAAVIIHPRDEARARSEKHRMIIAQAVEAAVLKARGRGDGRGDIGTLYARELLRNGTPPEEAARLSGLPLEDVLKFTGPLQPEEMPTARFGEELPARPAGRATENPLADGPGF